MKTKLIVLQVLLLAFVISLSSGCATHFVWTTGERTEWPMTDNIVSAHSTAEGGVEIVYEARVFQSNLKLLPRGTVTRRKSTKEPVFRRIVYPGSLFDEGMALNEISWQIDPPDISLKSYSLEGIKGLHSPGCQELVVSEIDDIQIDHDKIIRGGHQALRDAYKSQGIAFLKKLEKAKKQADFIVVHRLVPMRPHRADPFVVPAVITRRDNHTEVHVKSRKGKWVRLYLPRRTEKPKYLIPARVLLTPVAVVGDIVFLPVELVVCVVGLNSMKNIH